MDGLLQGVGRSVDRAQKHPTCRSQLVGEGGMSDEMDLLAVPTPREQVRSYRAFGSTSKNALHAGIPCIGERLDFRLPTD